MEKIKEQCPEFPHFGAKYPDARCIDGFLWDLDSGDGYSFTNGGDDPCPFCNTKEYIKYHVDPLNGITKERVINHIEFLKQRYS